jgi:SAM-dependent methyltransferase
MDKIFNQYAKYYDLLYADKDYAKEAQYVVGLHENHNASKPLSILELGCGTGKHAQEFSKMGVTVTGVDLSDAMVERANAESLDQCSFKNNFLVGDVRTIRLWQTFDTVISLFHVASYQTQNEDLLSMFKTAAVHLKTGGLFIFDFWYGPGVLSDPPGVRIKRLSGGGIEILRITEPEMFENENTVSIDFSVQIRSSYSRGLEEFNERHLMRYFFIPEIRHFLDCSNFKLLSAQEWLSTGLSKKSWQAVVVAQKI